MSDFKKLLHEQENKKREQESRRQEVWRNSETYRVGAQYSSKARRLLPFASRVLQKFAREAGVKLGHKGESDHHGYRCLAYYTFNKFEGFFGNKKRECGEVTIGPQARHGAYGATSGSVLRLNSQDYGNHLSDDQITEDWFKRQLVDAFSHLLRNR